MVILIWACCNRAQGQNVSYHDDENYSIYKVDWSEDEEGHDESAEWQYATNESDSTKNALSNFKDDAFHAKSFFYYTYMYKCYERKSVRDDSNDRKDLGSSSKWATTKLLHQDMSSATDGSLKNDNNLIKIQIKRFIILRHNKTIE